MQHTKLVQFTMCIAIFLCMLDTTIMNITLPAIQTGLHVSLHQLSWALNIYTIIFAVFTIPLSRIAEIKGKHKVYLIGLLTFMIGSLLSGVAINLSFLIIGRAIQSIGAAILFPVSMAIGIASAPLNKRKQVIATLGVTQGIAAALGPVIGGVLTQFLSWHWVFFINLPLLILALVLSLKTLSLKNEALLNVKIDWLGTFFLMLALFTLVLALLTINTYGIYSFPVLSLLCLSVLSTGLLLWTEHKVCDPIINLTLFKDRNFNGASLTSVLSNFYLIGVSVLLPTFFTKIQGTTELKAALLITPISFMIFIFSPLSANLLDKLGARWLMFLGFTFMSAGYFSLFHFNANHLSQIIITCGLIGAGYGILIGPIVVLSASNFTGELLTASQSVSGVLRQIGVTLSIAVFVTALTGNINDQSKLVKQDIKQQVTQSTLAKDTQNRVLVDIEKNMADQQTDTSQPKYNISTTERTTLIQKSIRLALQHIPKSQLTDHFMQQITAQVTKEVDQEIKATNQEINSLITTSKTIAKKRYAKAFSDIYRITFPFLIISMFSLLLFQKKNLNI